MEIAIVLGSTRQGRQSHRLAYYLQAQLLKNGATVHLIDLKDYALPLFGIALSIEQQKSVEEISALMKRSQAVVIVTPEYHSNISAATGNALEHCGLNLVGKVTAIAAASATQFGGVHAANNLRITLLNLGTHLCSKRLLVPEIHTAFTQDNIPVKEEIKNQAAQFISELLLYAGLIKDTALHEQHS